MLGKATRIMMMTHALSLATDLATNIQAVKNKVTGDDMRVGWDDYRATQTTTDNTFFELLEDIEPLTVDYDIKSIEQAVEQKWTTVIDKETVTRTFILAMYFIDTYEAYLRTNVLLPSSQLPQSLLVTPRPGRLPDDLEEDFSM